MHLLRVDAVFAQAVAGRGHDEAKDASTQARPQCGRCGVPVESFDETHDPFLERVRFRARCHGETETVDLPERDARGLAFGTAFNDWALARTV